MRAIHPSPLARPKYQQAPRGAVLLTAPVRYSDDNRLADLGLDVVRLLQPEREIIITKAVSWLLRRMVQHHKQVVAAYLKKNLSSLPAVAVRETRRKIATGPSSGIMRGKR